jgi:outer membrane protein TolC
MFLLMTLVLVSLSLGEPLRLETFLKEVVAGNRELKALREEIKAYGKEAEAAEKDLFPSLVIEERFIRTNVPAQVLFIKLNQERISVQDLSPGALRDPEPVSSFETDVRIEVPLWAGGKLRALRDIAQLRERVQRILYSEAKERIILEAYITFVNASLMREAVKVARKNLREAEEHLRIAEAMHRRGTALLSDVLRARVYLAKAEDQLRDTERRYQDLREAMSLLAGRDLSGYEPEPLSSCPDLPQDLLERSLQNRKDIKRLRETLRIIEVRRSLRMSEVMPSLNAFASYSLYDRDTPLGSEGGGYSFGLSLTLRLNLGLSTLARVRGEELRKKATLLRLSHLEEKARVSVRKAVREYRTSLATLESARRRLEEARETVRLVSLRYRNGLARMVDLLDAQTQLERARLEYLEALRRCHVSYARALFEAGLIGEVMR